MKKFNNKGFSLIELVVAIGIIAIAGTALFNGFIMSSRVHMNTVHLQMAEDTAQEIAEEFNSNYVDTLKVKYNTVITANPGAGGTITDSIVDGVRTVTFTNIPYSYEARPGAEESNYLVDVKLTSKKTANTIETVRDTTYKQSSLKADEFYEVNDTVGTNTFIIPEVTNIYDGKRIVVSNEINQYDNSVWSDLFNVLRQQLDNVNNLLVGDAKFNVNEFENAYTSLYCPYTNITNDDQLIKKTNILVKYESGGSGTLEFYYVVTIEFEFNFDYPLITMGGLLGPNLSDVIPDSSDLATVTGATSTYTVGKTGDTYTVTYKKLLDATEAGDGTTYGTFGGKIDTSSQNPSDPPLQIKADGTGDAVPYLYILYSPFDLYSDPSDGECNDEITFQCDIPNGSGSNIVRVFFVEQKLTNLADTTKTSKIVNCDIDSPFPEEVFKVYTNSTKVIDDSGNAFAGKNYLTNSYGKSRYNLYDMEITVKNMEGNTVASYNTIKEE